MSEEARAGDSVRPERLRLFVACDLPPEAERAVRTWQSQGTLAA